MNICWRNVLNDVSWFWRHRTQQNKSWRARKSKIRDRHVLQLNFVVFVVVSYMKLYTALCTTFVIQRCFLNISSFPGSRSKTTKASHLYICAGFQVSTFGARNLIGCRCSLAQLAEVRVRSSLLVCFPLTIVDMSALYSLPSHFLLFSGGHFFFITRLYFKQPPICFFQKWKDYFLEHFKLTSFYTVCEFPKLLMF